MEEMQEEEEEESYAYRPMDSILAPIFIEMMKNSARNGTTDMDSQLQEILRRRGRRPVSVEQLLQGIRIGLILAPAADDDNEKGKGVADYPSPTRDERVADSPLDDFDLIHRDALRDLDNMTLSQRLLVADAHKMIRDERANCIEVGSSDVGGSGSEASSQASRSLRRASRDIPFDQIYCRPTVYHPGGIFEELGPLPSELLRDPRAQSWGNIIKSNSIDLRFDPNPKSDVANNSISNFSIAHGEKEMRGREPSRLGEERSRHELCPWTARRRKQPMSSQSRSTPSPSSSLPLLFSTTRVADRSGRSPGWCYGAMI
ncbi:hypothetical protein DY000_02062984 [Brassica cretica]|uniref:Uncharacterized protein n=1 Tax=Brassica cretica TaxID=69181 RepID=A0ABQ7AUS5_BRACR|nr:hypothetical protein DY000_02062984 [Brassica cretica]